MTQRVLPAKVYDALQLSALMHGGVGAGRCSVRSHAVYSMEQEGDAAVPVCFWGHVSATNGCTQDAYMRAMGVIQESADISPLDNDTAVRAINARKGKGLRCNDRVSWEEFCAELNVVRGPEVETPAPVARVSETVSAG